MPTSKPDVTVASQSEPSATARRAAEEEAVAASVSSDVESEEMSDGPLSSRRRARLFGGAGTICMFLAVCAAHVESINAQPTASSEFDQRIAPLIAHRCLNCHGDTKPEGELNLSTRAAAMTGGESGKVILPGKLEESLLWNRVDSDEMPPDEPLPAAEKNLLKQWIANGAEWGTDRIDPFRFTTDRRAGYNWWSLQPLTHPEPPLVDAAAWKGNPIDAFVLTRLRAAGLSPSVEAGKRTLIRRLSFDLLGLPPTPTQIDAFLADATDQAYENLVDRLLESPHYGERWARHWLDVVRFGESNGFEYDQPRDNAWYYRNWVIGALNQDMPYDEFVRMQLAGDVLYPDKPANGQELNGAAAAGFLVAGAHNTTLPSSKKMQMTMAQDELEDLVGVVGQTFLGLTANCARCHDHKFDPISQKEYYQLAAALSGVKHGERTVRSERSPEQKKRATEITGRLAAIHIELEKVEKPIHAEILAERKSGKAESEAPEPPEPFATWEFEGDLKDSRGSLDAEAKGGARVEGGFLILDGKAAFAVTKPATVELEEKTLEAWVQLDDLGQRGGGVISVQTPGGGIFDAIVFGEREPKKWMAGSNGFVRYETFGGTEEADALGRPVHVAIVYQKDGTIIGYRDGQPYGKAYRKKPAQRFEPGKSQVIFGLRHSPAGGGRMLKGRIQRAQLFNRALTPDEVAASAGVADSSYVSESQLVARMTPAQRETREQQLAEIARLQSEENALAAADAQKLYTCVSSNPGVTRVLRRGSVTDPAEEVSPSGLAAVSGASADFGLAPDAKDADRRKKLAAWITGADNPLFARVMVNRIWHYHFGQGMVTTPSDFGYNGGQPSHPQLLDWLAESFRSGGFRLKPLHRLIVTSATYRQSSVQNAAAAKIDADNRLLWRKAPVRLEAEAIRDAVLVVTGQLNTEIGGVGYRDVRHFAFKGSNFYEPLAETGPEARRRTIYRFSARGGRNPFLDTFDCPDPSATAPKRATTTTPLQALALMNNALMFEVADEFSERVQREAGDHAAAQIAAVYLLAYGREAAQDEVKLASEFVKAHGLPSFCRVIINSNEFLYVQ